MTDNGNNEDDKKDSERDEKGRFLPGSRGGPGKKPVKPLTKDELEANLQKDMLHKDPKVRLAAMRVYLVLRKQMGSPKDMPLLDPRVHEAISKYINNDLLADDEVTEVDPDNVLFLKR